MVIRASLDHGPIIQKTVSQGGVIRAKGQNQVRSVRLSGGSFDLLMRGRGEATGTGVLSCSASCHASFSL